MSTTVWQFEHSLTLPFFGIGMKTDLFQSCGHCWVFQVFWYIEGSTLTASSFRIWNSSGEYFSSVQLLSCVQLFATPWTAARQTSLSITNSQSLLKLVSIESVMPSNHLILCCPLLLPPSMFLSLRVFPCKSLHQVTKVLEFQLQHQPFQWIFRTDFL